MRLNRTVAELLDSLSAHELGEWIAYHGISPIDDVRQDYGPALVASMVANVNRKSGAKPFQPCDFMPWLDQGEPEGEKPFDPNEEARRVAALFGVSHGANRQSGD